MRRREFILAVGGACAWSFTARAQEPERVRRMGVLMNVSADDPSARHSLADFMEALQKLGWNEGRNLHVDTRWGGGNEEDYRTYAAELVGLSPDVILAASTSIVWALQQLTRTVPIVFAYGYDPLGYGVVASLAHPGGNATGFSSFEFGMTGKWLGLLKQVAPNVTRAGVLLNPATVAGNAQLREIQEVAPSLGMETVPIDSRQAEGIESAIAAFARETNGGLIGLSSAPVVRHRDVIIALASLYKLPAVYHSRNFVESGGLISYGPDVSDLYRRAATYVDRILRGEKPANLPVQQPSKYELAINLKTARALGLMVPPTLLATADEVVE